MEKMKEYIHGRIEKANEEELWLMCILAGRIVQV